jgi:hypothetical protein
MSGFSRWVKGQTQGLQPGAFKLWVTTEFSLYGRPTEAAHAHPRPRGARDGHLLLRKPPGVAAHDAFER